MYVLAFTYLFCFMNCPNYLLCSNHVFHPVHQIAFCFPHECESFLHLLDFLRGNEKSLLALNKFNPHKPIHCKMKLCSYLGWDRCREARDYDHMAMTSSHENDFHCEVQST